MIDFRTLLLALPLSLAAGCATQAPPVSDTLAARRPAFPAAVSVTTAPRRAAPNAEPLKEAPFPVDRENNIYFDFGSAEIDPADRDTLRKLAARLKAEGDADLALIGHTDDLGSAEFNIALGQKRANAVAQALIALGVSPRRIRMTSLGNEMAEAANCVSEPCKATTRRVELRVVE